MAAGGGVGITVFERPGVALFLEKLAEFAEVGWYRLTASKRVLKAPMV
jgi:hypothetical protein